MQKGSGRVTAADVARRSGVSQATVSYVLNKKDTQKIGAETRERILRAVDELGYQPYEPARALRSGRSNVVMFVAANVFTGHVVGRFLDALTSRLAPTEYALVTHRYTDDLGLLEVVRALSPTLVISMTALSEDVRGVIRTVGGRLEVMGFRESHDADVRLPQEEVGYLQASHLIERGHRRLACAMPILPDAAFFSEPRRIGVERACVEHGLEVPLVETVGFDRGAAEATVRRWRKAGITGVCALVDDVAIALIAGAHDAGCRVPDDLAIIGVDDIPYAALVTPALTTVYLDVASGVDELLTLAGLSVGEQTVRAEVDVKPSIIQRSST